jgi:hypothetical protein
MFHPVEACQLDFSDSDGRLEGEKTSVGISFLEELQPRPLSDNGSLQGCETKTFGLQLFAQGKLLGR